MHVTIFYVNKYCFFFSFMMSFLSPADPPNKDNKPRILEVNFYFVFF